MRNLPKDLPFAEQLFSYSCLWLLLLMYLLNGRFNYDKNNLAENALKFYIKFFTSLGDSGYIQLLGIDPVIRNLFFFSYFLHRVHYIEHIKDVERKMPYSLFYPIKYPQRNKILPHKFLDH